MLPVRPLTLPLTVNVDAGGGPAGGGPPPPLLPPPPQPPSATSTAPTPRIRSLSTTPGTSMPVTPTQLDSRRERKRQAKPDNRSVASQHIEQQQARLGPFALDRAIADAAEPGDLLEGEAAEELEVD